MKRIIVLIFASLLFLGCQKHQVELLFDALPEERIAEKLQELQSKLLESPSGWKATLNTGASSNLGAYSFYIVFDKDNECKMVGDLNAESSANWGMSTYRILWTMKASLIFDTFNYITMLQEPSASFGGTAPHGYRSDIEFEYVNSNADSIFMVGKKYQHKMVLTKISAESNDLISNKKFKSKIDEVTAFFTRNLNSYFELDNAGTKYALALDRLTKSIIINWMEGTTVKSVKSAYAYSLDGADIFQPLVINGLHLDRIEVADDGTAKIVSEHDAYNLKNNSVPILPISSLFAHNSTFNELRIEGAFMPVGISSEFNTLWSQQIAHLQANNASMVSFIFRLVNSNTASLLVRFNTGGSTYLAQADYNYTLSNGELILSAPIATNGNYNNGWVTGNIRNYFSGGKFKVDYVPSTDPSVVNIGGLYKTDNLGSFFYARLMHD